MRILLVEDDEHIAELLTHSLTEQHYVVDIATDGQAGWELAEELSYNLILLDVMLPKLDGISFCRQLRSRGNQVPVLLLTAKDTSTDKVMGLDAGADDYVVKPITPQELSARIRALLRRGRVVASPVLKWGNLHLDPSSCEVTYNNSPLRLTPKEYALLELFMRNGQRVYSRSAILDQLWSFEEPPGEDTVKAHIKGLRQRLKAVGAADLVETVYGLGYRLNTTYLKTATPAAPTASPAKESQQQQTKAIVAKIWKRARPKIIAQVNVVEQALQASLAGALENGDRHQALQTAHKLAGSLGTFGVEGSHIAHQIETLLQSEVKLDQSQVKNFQELVTALRQVVEAAHSSPPEETQTGQTSQLEDETSTNNCPEDQKPLLLIVDDDQELAELLSVEAKSQGLRVAIASTPQLAGNIIDHTRPDVVLLDLSFADADETGITLLSELAHSTPALPVIVFTGNDQITDRVAAARLQARSFLQKPTTPTQVLEAITQVLQQTQVVESRVLVVDDDPLILEALRALLEPWGLRVSTLQNPLKFWSALGSTTPELLILDVNMPEVDGIELCQTLRNDPRWGWLPVLFLTAQTNADTIHQIFSAGADDYVSKPIVAPELVTRILNRLERTRMLRNLAETDALTGVANRQQATQDLERFLQLAKRSQQHVCLAVLKIDRLKQINQQHGYGVGDRILRQVGQLLQQKLRREDVVSRWSGTEFVVGIYGMTRSDGVELLAEILEVLRPMQLPLDAKELLQITFSAGVVQYPTDGGTLKSLHQAANTVLEQAHLAGGDRVLPVGWQPAQLQSSLSTDVVLVNHDATFANLVLRALETRGYHSHWLQDGKAAIETLAGTNPHLRTQVILLAEELPSKNGLEVLKRLARDKVTKHSRVILLPTQTSAVEKALELGIFDYIVTPCSTAVLMQHLRRAFRS